MFQAGCFLKDLKYALSQSLEETNYSAIVYDQILANNLESKAHMHLNTIKNAQTQHSMQTIYSASQFKQKYSKQRQ